MMKKYFKQFLWIIFLGLIISGCKGAGTETGNPYFRDKGEDVNPISDPNSDQNPGSIGFRPDNGNDVQPSSPSSSSDSDPEYSSADSIDNSDSSPEDTSLGNSQYQDLIFLEANFCKSFQTVCHGQNQSDLEKDDFEVIDQGLIITDHSSQLRIIDSTHNQLLFENDLNIKLPEIDYATHQFIYLLQNIEDRYYSFFLAYYWQDTSKLHLVISEKKYDCEVFQDHRSIYDLVKIPKMNLPIEIHYLSEVISCGS